MKGLFKAKPRTPSQLVRSSRELLDSIDLLAAPGDPKREEKILDIFVVVEELHDISAKEMNKILRDSNNRFTFLLKEGRGSSMRIDVERLVLALPLHLLACLASRGSELRLRYLLHGVRLLHSLSDLAVRHQKLEQVNLFMDAAFDAVGRDIGLLQNKLRVLNSKLMNGKMTQAGAECIAQVIGQQCEASIQVLQSLCQPHAFRDKLLNHKELCRKGGLLRLAIAVLKLQLPYSFQESKYLTGLFSRLQSKILSMLVKFCETEPVSFLDEVAIEPRTMHLAEAVAGEVLALVQVALREDSGRIQSSTENFSANQLLYINALHLADIFSDVSNFRNFVMDYITSDLTQVLLQAPTIFSSEWYESQVDFDASKSWSDAVLVYDPFRAAGAAMQSFKGSLVSGSMPLSSSAPFADEYSGCSLLSEQILPASYAPKRASLFVKIIANLHCFNPDICAADEKDRFLKIFVDSLTKHAFNPTDKSFFLSTVQTAVRICENLLLLLEHVSCLPSEVVSDEDVQLVSTFYDALHDAICPGVSEPSFHEDPVVGYVRDAHEQKRRAIFAPRLQSERWRRIQRYSEVSDKEQSTSNNKTVTKPPSNQQNVEDDTCQKSEEAQSKGNKSYTERQDLVDPGDETEEVQIINKMEEHAAKEERGAWMDTEEIESRGLTESLIKIETWDRESTEVQSIRPIEDTVEVDFFPRDLVIVQSTHPHIDEMKSEKEYWEKEGERGKLTVEGDQCDFTCTEISKYVQNEEAGDFKLENLELLDAAEDKNQIIIYTPLNVMKDEYTTDGKLEDIEIHGNAMVIDYHEDTHKGLEEINVEKVENLTDNIDLKTDVDMGQESSHNMVGNTRGSAESEIQPNDTHAIQKPLVTTPLGEEIQPKKRKRNIMNEKQMIVIENALKTEPDMQRYPKLIQQWTTQLNKIGPELSYQQLKNWLNNRKARLARQAREARGLEGEARVHVFEADCLSSLDVASQSKHVSRYCGNYSGSPSEHKNSMTEDGQVRESGSFTRTCMPGTIIGFFQTKHIEEDLGIGCPMEFDSYYSHGCEFPDVTKVQGASRVSASVKFVKCEVGQYVSLLDTERKEIAHGIVNQVDGK